MVGRDWLGRCGVGGWVSRWRGGGWVRVWGEVLG